MPSRRPWARISCWTNTRIDAARIAALIGAADMGLVMLVGVQSNQFPRALDIARPLRQRGIMVGIGGFHVSGTIAMLARGRIAAAL